MTFIEMAKNFGEDLPEDQLKQIANAMEYAYCAALKSSSYRLGGINYLGEGRDTKRLSDVVEEVRKRGGPL